MSNYATKTDSKNVTHVDVSSFATKTNLAGLKTEVDKLHIGKLLPVPIDLANFSNVVKIDTVKKNEYNGLVSKLNNTDTTGFVLETEYDRNTGEINKTIKRGGVVASKDDLDDVEKKIPNVSGFLLTSVFNSKVTEVENRIKYLAGKTKLTSVKNKKPNVSSLVTKPEYAVKISKIKND